MPSHLLTPLYLTDEPLNWDGFITPAVLLTQPRDASKTGSNISIRWDACDAYDQQTVHDLIMGYDARGATAGEANAVTAFAATIAYQVINYSGTLVAGNPVNLETGKTYTASAVVNGTEYPISLVGVAGETFTNLLVRINAVIAGPATVIINADSNFEIQSNATGAPQIVEIFDGDLFNSISGFAELEEIRVGVTVIGDIFDLNFRNKYQSYTELLIGKLRNVSNGTFRSAKNVNDEYFNHGTKTWLNLITDA